MPKRVKRVGYACAHTPLAIIDAAGLTPYRVLPLGEWPEKAGHRSPESLCPPVKRILDRGLQNGIPDVAGMVFVNRCGSMRRLADAWQCMRPDDRTVLVDLPVRRDGTSAVFLGGELQRLAGELSRWSGREISEDALRASMAFRNRLAERLETLRERHGRGVLPEGAAWLQAVANRVAVEPPERALAFVEGIAGEPEGADPEAAAVPVFLFGNVLPDPEVFILLESLGARVVSEDLYAGGRSQRMDADPAGEPFLELARGLLASPSCAHMPDPSRPGGMAEDLLAAAKTTGARGVIGCAVEFCNPSHARMPVVRDLFRKAGLPLLLLDGDCTVRSLGRHRARIEAFIDELK